MSNPFEAYGIDVPQIVADHLPGVPATLTVKTPGTRTGGALAGGTNPTLTEYPCRGWVENVEKKPISGSNVQETIRTVVLIAKTIAGGTVAPKDGDDVEIDGSEGRIVGVPDRDGASATWTCKVHG